MQTRTFGRVGKPVSRLGLGLAALGRPGYINLGHGQDLRADYELAAMRSRAHAVLDAAWSAGIRYFDAARSYGQAEAFLADWLAQRQIDPGAVVVGSKWGYTYTAGWKVAAEKHEVKDHSLAMLRRQLRKSQAVLGTQLDLYQIHSATLESGVLEDRAVLEELFRLRTTGVRIGLSVTGPRQADAVRRALGVAIESEPLFDCVQATWNLLEPSAGAALAEAHTAGFGVIVKEALANGRLTQRNRAAEFARGRHLLEEAATAQGVSVDALALSAVLAQPWADVVLSGASTEEQLDSNLKALAVRWDRGLDEALGTLAERPEEYWNIRSRLPWN